MTDESFAGAADGPVLTSRSWERQVELAFTSYQPTDDYVGEYVVRVTADGLSALVPVITSVGGDNLPGFIDGLCEAFRGWEGSQHWRSLEDQLRIEATWADGGHVRLRFRARPSVYDLWAVAACVTLEAGEEMRRLGADLRAFFVE